MLTLLSPRFKLNLRAPLMVVEAENRVLVKRVNTLYSQYSSDIGGNFRSYNSQFLKWQCSRCRVPLNSS